MRALLALLASASLLLASPRVRWVDKEGAVHDEPIEEVLSESPSAVKVRLTGGEAIEIDCRRLVDLVREDEEDPEQRELYLARLAIAAEESSDEVRATLDRFAVRKGWMGEYASATRAFLAARDNEQGSGDRVAAFEGAYPESRFRNDMELARAYLESHAGNDMDTFLNPFLGSWDRIEKRGGPLLLQWRGMLAGTRLVKKKDLIPIKMFLGTFAGRVKDIATANPKDAAVTIIGESALRWAELLIARDWHALMREPSYRPIPVRTMLRSCLVGAGTLLLPDVLCDLEYELALVEEACGDRTAGIAGMKRAADLAPDPRRRALVDAQLKRMEAAN